MKHAYSTILASFTSLKSDENKNNTWFYFHNPQISHKTHKTQRWEKIIYYLENPVS